MTLTETDVQMVVNAVAREYGSEEVVLPDLRKEKNYNLVNSDAARNGMTVAEAREVNVEFPDGWSVVDKVPPKKDYKNYYLSSLIQKGYLAPIAKNDTRLLASTTETLSASPYTGVQDLLKMSLIERAILGALALQDSEKNREGETESFRT